MKLSPSVLALLLGAIGPAAAADEQRLRGLQTVQSEILSTGGCILAAISELHIPGAADAGSEFEESLACMNEFGQVTPITADATQMSSVLEKAASGEVRFGETQVDLGNGIRAASDGSVVLAEGAEIRVVKGPKGRGGGRRRGLQGADGERYFVVFRVTDSEGSVNPDDAATISDNIFGTGNDQVNLKSQMHAISNGKYTVVPGIYEDPDYDLGTIQAAPGVVEITIPVPHSAGGTLSGGGFNTLVAAAQAKFEVAFGISNMLDHMDHALFVIPANDGYNWAAYAYINGWGQVYQGVYNGQAGVLLHEHGHNMGLAHSGGLDNQPYTDHTGLMGNPLYADELGRMCFNPAKNWQLQLHPGAQVIEPWYDDEAFLELDPNNDLPRSVKMMGIGEYSNQPTPLRPVALKISATSAVPMYVGFNSDKGANAHNDEADNEVTLVQKAGNQYGQSWLRAHLEEGEWHDYEGILVEATCINAAITPSVACVCVRRADEACPPCVCDDGGAPTSPPTASSPPTPLCTSFVTVDVLTDNYPGETAWTLVDKCSGDLVGSAAEGHYSSANAPHSDEFCHPSSEFEFTITDAYGDGNCCGYGQGGYSVKVNEEEMAAGGEFGASETKVFGECAAPTIGSTPPPVNAPTVASTPPPTVASTPPPTVASTPPPTVASTPPPTVASTPPPTVASTPPPTVASTPPPTVASTPPPTVASPVTSPTLPPVPSPDGVITIDLFRMRFTFSPGPVCVDLGDTEGQATGSSPGQCAHSCAVLANCDGFVNMEDTGTCVLSTSDDFDDCGGSEPNAVFYERSAVMHLER